MPSPDQWERSKKRETGNTVYYWRNTDKIARVYIIQRNDKYFIRTRGTGQNLSNKFESFTNKEKARKQAVAWMRKNKL